MRKQLGRLEPSHAKQIFAIISITGLTLLGTCGYFVVTVFGQAVVMERLSVDNVGQESNGDSGSPTISSDGRFVAFESVASNLVTGDANTRKDIFVHDRQSGQTIRISVATGGQEGNGDSGAPAISNDGRFVAFESVASNLVTGDTNRRKDIFVHDRQSGQTTRVSVATGSQEGNGDSGSPAISSDGRFAAFESTGSNLVTGDGNGRKDIFVHDRQSGETTRISVTTGGVEGNGDSGSPAISSDGRFVAFESVASNLVTGDGNGRKDIFVHDRQSGQTTRVSVATGGQESNGDSSSAAISSDGRFVAFESLASNLVTGDTNRRKDIFVHDRQSGQTSRVSVATAGQEGNGDSGSVAISSDGWFVAFESVANNLVSNDTNGRKDIFVHDRQKQRTTRESVAAPGIEATGNSESPSLSGNGSVVAFASVASNLVLDDGNRRKDVFAHEPTQQADLIAQGENIFFNEKFEGNGRTCGTCHPAEKNFTIDPAFIAKLPANDPLFVAEFNPALAGLENSRLMREFGLILENVDGFDKPGVMRGVPHTLGLPKSILSFSGPRTGWSGDGSADGSLRAFTTGAVFQHFTKTLNRIPGIDFRLPTEEELDAVEAFMLSLGRQNDLSLPLSLKGAVPSTGQQIFLDNSVGKCNLCHVNAGANVNLGAGNLGNANFDTAVEDFPNPARLIGEPMSPDRGLGRSPHASGGFGDRSFNVPSLVEAADTGPFFHNNAVQTIEEAVNFYTSAEFNNSQAAIEIGGGIDLDSDQVVAIAAFLRVINALEKTRIAIELQEKAFLSRNRNQVSRFLSLVQAEIDGAISVLEGGDLHPEAVGFLEEAKRLIARRRIQPAIDMVQSARDELVDSP